MDNNRKHAYTFLLSAAVLHLKWDLASVWGGLSLVRPWRLLRESRSVVRAAHRATAFHNLAILQTLDFAGFSEEHFWDDIDAFRQQFPNDWADYRAMFERTLAGEKVLVVKPN